MAAKKDAPHDVDQQSTSVKQTVAPPSLMNPENGRQSSYTHSSNIQSRSARQSEDGSSEFVRQASSQLNEVAAPHPIENPNEQEIYQHEDLESIRSRHEGSNSSPGSKSRGQWLVECLSQLYIASYLILFAILGTLARLGLQALTTYPGSPVITSVLWPNFAGSFIMGFLSQDMRLFRHKPIKGLDETVADADTPEMSDEHMAKKLAKQSIQDHLKYKKGLPLYIGLTTGFCGSFTSFSSFARDAFLALSDDLTEPKFTDPLDRSKGDSFLALTAVVIVTVTACTAAIKAGAHFALLLDGLSPTISARFLKLILDPLVIPLAFGCWLGAIFMCIWPPDRPGGPDSAGIASVSQEVWRSRALFALVFGPLGCLARFYASIHLNGVIFSFPLGTFTVNIAGTAILGMCYDLQRARLPLNGLVGGGYLGCQVLQGIQDGFCGCLTTVSTWVLELTSLRRSHAYRYGTVSVLASVLALVVIVGSLKWSIGFSEKSC
jgi:CrcB protein